ncbi:hypothetical protein [Methylomonas rapida]|uniref:Uncharacterized protein n=1 Tax=Methylomonas rapida TaxID=2963939 RepID=A0ABY7GHF7_9GAMM|nr:hypothetical protein [Methylomonas rapida]WAR43876.1 hypothetical protein NM686_016065 [Methylomonas rapida]
MICSIQIALLQLFEAAKDNLDDDQLIFFGNLLLHADEEAQNLCNTVTALAMCDVSERLPDGEIQSVLLGLANRAGTIAALIQIGAKAKQMAAERKGGAR